MKRALVPLLLLGAGILTLLIVAQQDGPTRTAATFVPAESCARCHAEQHGDWQGSHHDLAMDHATPTSVLGDFADTSFTQQGETSRFFRKGDRFYVNTKGPDGALHDYEILYTIGWEPLQQYLIDTGDGRLQCLQISWDTAAKRWFHIQDERIGHTDVLHWTGLQFNANTMCIECHVTGYDRGYTPESGAFASTWHGIDVGCQACHGPGSGHVAWAEGGEPADATKGLEVVFKGADAAVQVEHCARCHARRVHTSSRYAHGDPLLDHFAARLLTAPLYHADGQIKDEVYVYGSFLQAKKHAQGVRCSDCHDPHTARLKFEGNALCLQCHQKETPERFATLRKAAYDTPAHHFHKTGTPGSHCVDCHMPAKTYMQVDPRHDHSFRVPRPDLTLEIGTPNACNGCHTERSPQWALKEIAERFPDFVRGRVAGGHWGKAFAGARAGDPQAFKALAKLATAMTEPTIVRATAVHYLQRYAPADAVRAIAPALIDADGLVRATAAAAIGALVPAGAPAGLQQQTVHVLGPLLRDPLRAVRMEVARALAGAPEPHLDAADKRHFDRALGEWIERQEADGGRPEAQLNLGALYETRQQAREAEAAYRRALTLDPHFAPARFNLATLLNRSGRNAEAEQLLTAIVTRNAANGDAWYSLGLLRSERKNAKGAAEALAHAARLLPTRGRVHYNYALALQAVGDSDVSLVEMATAHRLAPRDVRILEALVMMQVAREAWASARVSAEALIELRPDHAGTQEALRQIRAKLRR